MSLDALFAEVKAKKLLITNLYQGTDDQWRCWLRKHRNNLGKMYGIGATPNEALRGAIDWKPEEPEPRAAGIEDQFADLL